MFERVGVGGLEGGPGGPGQRKCNVGNVSSLAEFLILLESVMVL